MFTLWEESRKVLRAIFLKNKGILRWQFPTIQEFAPKCLPIMRQKSWLQTELKFIWFAKRSLRRSYPLQLESSGAARE